MKDAEFAIKNEARQKKMQEERAVKIAKEEKEREEKEAFDNMGKTILSTTSTIYEKSTLLADSVVPTVSKQYQSRSVPKPFPEATQSISNHARKTRRPKLSSLLMSKQMKRTNRNESGF